MRLFRRKQRVPVPSGVPTRYSGAIVITPTEHEPENPEWADTGRYWLYVLYRRPKAEEWYRTNDDEYGSVNEAENAEDYPGKPYARRVIDGKEDGWAVLPAGVSDYLTDEEVMAHALKSGGWYAESLREKRERGA